MIRLICVALLVLIAGSSAQAESIYTDKTGRSLRMYYSWAIDAAGSTKLNVQLVNYSSVTWVDIVLNCDVLTGFGATRAARKEVTLNSVMFDFELTKEINDIDLGQLQPKGKLSCAIVQAGQGERTLKSLPQMAPVR